MADSTPPRLPFGHAKSGPAQPKPKFEVVEEDVDFEVVEEEPRKVFCAAPDEEPKPQKPRKKKKKKGLSLADKLLEGQGEDQERRDAALRSYEYTMPAVLLGIGETNASTGALNVMTLVANMILISFLVAAEASTNNKGTDKDVEEAAPAETQSDKPNGAPPVMDPVEDN